MPDAAMRIHIVKLLFLALLGNGIACACPAVTAPAGHAQDNSSTPHEHHQREISDCHDDDCDGNCSDHAAPEVQRPAAAANVKLLPRGDNDTGDTAVLRLVRTEPWPRGQPALREPPACTGLRPAQSPVSLKDRMLD